MSTVHLLLSCASVLVLMQCKEPHRAVIHGKVRKEMISIAPKVTGRIISLYVQEGASVQLGDTLALLDIPEVEAKVAQAKSAVAATSAQRLLTDNGATSNQIRQLRAKHTALREQFDFATKSYKRTKILFDDSLVAPQVFDEAFLRYQAAKAQLDAADAELNEAVTGIRIETKLAAQAHAAQAKGILKEVEVAFKERYVLATNSMTIETIAVRAGELATAGYPIFSGYIIESTWFRFTVPESEILPYNKGKVVDLHVPYCNRVLRGKILTIRQLPRYADISTAYPDYSMDDAIYELKIHPIDSNNSDELLYNATVTLSKQ